MLHIQAPNTYILFWNDSRGQRGIITYAHVFAIVSSALGRFGVVSTLTLRRFTRHMATLSQPMLALILETFDIHNIKMKS